MEIRRFGVGNRRKHGSVGTRGVTSQTIHADARGSIAELVFGRHAILEPQLSPNTTWLLVVEGGGWVQAGEERTLVAAGEAVLLPAGVPHGAWTEHSEMRAVLVELTGPDDSHLRGILEGPRPTLAEGRPVAKGEGRLVRDPGAGSSALDESDPIEGEPA